MIFGLFLKKIFYTYKVLTFSLDILVSLKIKENSKTRAKPQILFRDLTFVLFEKSMSGVLTQQNGSFKCDFVHKLKNFDKFSKTGYKIRFLMYIGPSSRF